MGNKASEHRFIDSFKPTKNKLIFTALLSIFFVVEYIIRIYRVTSQGYGLDDIDVLVFSVLLLVSILIAYSYSALQITRIEKKYAKTKRLKAYVISIVFFFLLIRVLPWLLLKILTLKRIIL